MEVWLDHRVRILLHQECHRIQHARLGRRLALLQRIAVLADEGGMPAIAGLASRRLARDFAVCCQDHESSFLPAYAMTLIAQGVVGLACQSRNVKRSLPRMRRKAPVIGGT